MIMPINLKTASTTLFIIYHFLLIFTVVILRKKLYYNASLYHIIIKILFTILLIGSLLTYFVYAEYIENRPDSFYIISIAEAVLHRENPYNISMPSYYGPVYNFLIAPVYLMPKNHKIVSYGVFVLSLMFLTSFLVVRKIGMKDPVFLAVVVASDPVIHYYGIALAQIDDMLISFMIMLTLLIIIYGYEKLRIIMIVVSSLVKPVGAFLLATLFNKGSMIKTVVTIFLILSLNILSLYVYGEKFLYNVYLVHSGRSDGLTISFLLDILFKRSFPQIFSYTAVLLSLLSPILVRDKDPIKIIMNSFIIFYIFTPLDFPEYLIWITPVIIIKTLLDKDLALSIFYSMTALIGRLWQDLIQSTGNYYSLINSVLIISYITLLTCLYISINKDHRNKRQAR